MAHTHPNLFTDAGHEFAKFWRDHNDEEINEDSVL